MPWKARSCKCAWKSPIVCSSSLPLSAPVERGVTLGAPQAEPSNERRRAADSEVPPAVRNAHDLVNGDTSRFKEAA
eukprot:5345195-Alexandrium_andersonii.AAC.1